MARIEAKAAKFFDRMDEVDLLIIEDYGIEVLDGHQLMEFMGLIEDWHAPKSIIITSQLPVKNWYDVLAKNTTVADAVLDRLAKTAHRFELIGDSTRKKSYLCQIRLESLIKWVVIAEICYNQGLWARKCLL